MLLCCHGLSPQASICRSSQPLSGFSARCLEDEQMLQAIRKANPGSDFIYVVDTRPKVSVAILMLVFAALNQDTCSGCFICERAVPLCMVSIWLPCKTASWVSEASNSGTFGISLAAGMVLGTPCMHQMHVVRLILETTLLNTPNYGLFLK